MTKSDRSPRDLADELVKAIKVVINFIRGKKIKVKVHEIHKKVYQIEYPYNYEKPLIISSSINVICDSFSDLPNGTHQTQTATKLDLKCHQAESEKH